MKEYRLRDGIRAVKLDSEGHGEFAMLSPGCVVRLGGRTPLRGFVEIICDGEKLSVFREDLEDKSEKLADALTGPAEEENP